MTEHRLPAVIGPLTPAQIKAQMASGHSVYSPSASEMTMTCEESLVLNVLADDVQTFEAAEGTVAHSCGEHWLKSRERPDQWIGMTEVVNGFDIEITDEMLGFVGDFVDLCREIIEKCDHWASEQYVDISKLTPIPDQGGTADFAGFSWQKLWIVDLKYGKDPVFPDSKQLKVYALGVFYEWDWLYNFQEIELYIAQPRLAGGMGAPHVMTRAELLEFAEFAKARWALTWQPRELLTRTPSTKGCRWCKARATCPALYLFLADENDVFTNYDEMDAASAIIDVVPSSVTYEQMSKANEIILDEFATSPFPALPEPLALSTQALAKLLRYRKLMENFFNAIAAELLSRAVSREEEILWWKIVESRTRRKWVEDHEHIVEAIVGLGRGALTDEDCYVTTLKSPAEMERMLHTKLKMSLGKAKAFLDDGLTVKPPGQKTLAATTDNRLALPKDSDVFINYDLEDDDI